MTARARVQDRSAAQALRAALRRRIPVPRSILVCAAAGIALAAAYAGLYVALRNVDLRIAQGLLRMFLITPVAGRETAMLDALQGSDPMPVGWVLFASLVDDIGTLLLTIALVWVAYEALRRVRPVQAALLDVEKQALLHRSWVRRWGLAGLAFFFFLPGFGTGVVVSTMMGVLARIPPARLAWTLGLSAVAVDALWVAALRGAVSLLPKDAWWVGILPLAIIALVVAATALGILRNRRTRHIQLLELPAPPTPAQLGRLRGYGIAFDDGVLHIDTRQLRSFVPLQNRVDLHAAAGILVLDGMMPAQAAELVRLGVAAMQDLARIEPALVCAALAEAGTPVPAERATAWRGQAVVLAALTGSAWRS